MIACKECDNPATLVEYYDAKSIERFVCQDHAFSFNPHTHFISIDEWRQMANHIPQDLYNEIISLIPIVCVDVAIVYDNKILLIKRGIEPAAGEWWLPGGRLYKSETLEACALRKAKEETGLECELGPMIYYASTNFGAVHSVNFCYLLFASDDNVKLDDTCLDFGWIATYSDTMFGSELRPYIGQCLSKAFGCLRAERCGYEI